TRTSAATDTTPTSAPSTDSSAAPAAVAATPTSAAADTTPTITPSTDSSTVPAATAATPAPTTPQSSSTATAAESSLPSTGSPPTATASTPALSDTTPHTVSIPESSGNVITTVDGATSTSPAADVTDVKVNGGAGNDTFTVAAIPIPVTLTGGEGNDTYKFGDGFGDVTVVEAPGGGIDTLDFTAVTGSISHPTDLTFVASSGGTVTISGSASERVDLKLNDPARFAGGIKSVFDGASAAFQQALAQPELSSPLPLLDPSGGSDIAAILGLDDSFAQLAALVDTALSSSAPGSVGDVVASLHSLGPSLPQLLRGLDFSSRYSGSNGDLLVYITASMNQLDPLTCTAGSGCVRKTINLDSSSRLGAVHLTPASGSSSTFDV